MPTLRGEQLTLGYERRIVAADLNIEIPAATMSAVIGPNASGKSTLVRALARLITPLHGTVLLDGKAAHRLPTKEFARRVGLLPQQSTAPFGITVGDLVARGRYPHHEFLQQWTRADEAAVEQALRSTRLRDMVDRQVDELSGGQRQRVWIALLLAQNPAIMLLDEPTTYLDIANQLELLELCQHINRRDGRTIVLVLHELTLAARYADFLIVMHEGRIVASGKPEDVLTEALLAEVFRIQARILPDPAGGRSLIVPLASLREEAL